MDIKPLGNTNPRQLAANAAPAEEPSRNQSVTQVSAASQAAEQPQASSAELEEAVAHLQDYAQNTSRSLQFRLDDSTGMVVVQVFAKDSGELIRQIPSEEALRLAEQLDEARNLLFEARA